MIKKIYCFGTSHTAGGGFHDKNVKNVYKNIVDNPSMETCSWPGIFKTYLDKNIEVINLAECGAGNERIYRLVFDLITNPKIKNEESLLLIELSTLGRKEFYSNTANDYVICNYHFQDLPGKNFDVVKQYYKDYKLPSKTKEIYKNFLLETVDEHDLMKRLQRNLYFFLSFLDTHKINYELTCYDNRIFTPEQKDFFGDDRRGIEYIFNGKKNCNWYDGGNWREYLITNETDGVIRDQHQGYWASEIAAQTIYNYLIDKKWIKGTKQKINNSHKDFLVFKEKLNQKNFLI